MFGKKIWKSEGKGTPNIKKLKKCGSNVIIEDGVRIFYPENIEIGDNVYIGHDTILKGYYNSILTISSNVWIGQQCFFHAAGGLFIGENVGIGPKVSVLTSGHKECGIETPILFSELEFSSTIIGEDCNIGVGAIVLPGIKIGKGSKIGAGAVVSKNISEYSVAVGVPAKIISSRK
ncbi:DapH/DapD/GlmU-related protein [Clostridium botulinum]|uniref:DapH/DapD/GlmU-related protein n=1 Tax=Clostridium botulinum TaxID=1491 RepID=UPI001967E3B9|nr:transferase [Clostridium botulinum]